MAETGYNHLLRPEYGSPDVKYGLHNFHREDSLERMHSFLESNSGAVALLEGRLGSGRQYFLQAVCHRMRQGGSRVALCSLDLDGFEPDQGGLAAYFEHLLRKQKDLDDATRRQVGNILLGMVQGAEKTLFPKSLLGLLLNFHQPIQKLVDYLQANAATFVGPRRSEFDFLSHLFGELRAEQQLIVHIPDHHRLTSQERIWLLGEVDQGHLIVVFSCRPNEPVKEIAPLVRKPIERFDFAPLDRHDLRSVLDLHFQPNNFPDSLIDILWKQTGGEPSTLAIDVFNLLHQDGFLESPSGWHLPPLGIESDAVVNVFKQDLYAPINRVLHNLDAYASELQRFLLLAALCGPNVPSGLILEAMGLGKEARDDVIDLIDEWFVEDDVVPLFEDIGFQHPAFPRHVALYRFRHILLFKSILEQVEAQDREAEAIVLLDFLQDRLPVTSRAVARLFLNLCEHVSSEDRAGDYRLWLAWWSGMDEAERLRETLIKQLEAGDIRAETLWKIVGIAKTSWPPYRRMAILQAYERQPDDMPEDRLGHFRYERGDLQLDLGKYREALEDGQYALDRFRRQYGERSLNTGQALDLCGRTYRQLGMLESAETHLKQALHIYEAVLGSDHPDVATWLNNLANLYRDQGRYEEAEPLYERALRIGEQTLGSDHPDVATWLNNLASLYQNQGRYAAAEPLFLRCLAIFEVALGSDHPNTQIVRQNYAAFLQARDAAG